MNFLSDFRSEKSVLKKKYHHKELPSENLDFAALLRI